MTEKEALDMLKEQECDELEFKGKCHDCGVELSVLLISEQGKISVYNGAIYKIKEPSIREDGIFLKCNSCFEKNKRINNWRPLEVWTRCVGYLRPVGQFNNGKKAEFQLRKNYNLNKTIKEV
jgi:hypothetical protein